MGSWVRIPSSSPPLFLSDPDTCPTSNACDLLWGRKNEPSGSAIILTDRAENVKDAAFGDRSARMHAITRDSENVARAECVNLAVDHKFEDAFE
eukprot:gene43506-57925_t